MFESRWLLQKSVEKDYAKCVDALMVVLFKRIIKIYSHEFCDENKFKLYLQKIISCMLTLESNHKITTKYSKRANDLCTLLSVDFQNHTNNSTYHLSESIQQDSNEILTNIVKRKYIHKEEGRNFKSCDYSESSQFSENEENSVEQLTQIRGERRKSYQSITDNESNLNDSRSNSVNLNDDNTLMNYIEDVIKKQSKNKQLMRIKNNSSTTNNDQTKVIKDSHECEKNPHPSNQLKDAKITLESKSILNPVLEEIQSDDQIQECSPCKEQSPQILSLDEEPNKYMDAKQNNINERFSPCYRIRKKSCQKGILTNSQQVQKENSQLDENFHQQSNHQQETKKIFQKSNQNVQQDIKQSNTEVQKSEIIIDQKQSKHNKENQNIHKDEKNIDRHHVISVFQYLQENEVEKEPTIFKFSENFELPVKICKEQKTNKYFQINSNFENIDIYKCEAINNKKETEKFNHPEIDSHKMIHSDKKQIRKNRLFSANSRQMKKQNSTDTSSSKIKTIQNISDVRKKEGFKFSKESINIEKADSKWLQFEEIHQDTLIDQRPSINYLFHEQQTNKRRGQSTSCNSQKQSKQIINPSHSIDRLKNYNAINQEMDVFKGLFKIGSKRNKIRNQNWHEIPTENDDESQIALEETNSTMKKINIKIGKQSIELKPDFKYHLHENSFWSNQNQSHSLHNNSQVNVSFPSKFESQHNNISKQIKPDIQDKSIHSPFISNKSSFTDNINSTISRYNRNSINYTPPCSIGHSTVLSQLSPSTNDKHIFKKKYIPLNQRDVYITS